MIPARNYNQNEAQKTSRSSRVRDANSFRTDGGGMAASMVVRAAPDLY